MKIAITHNAKILALFAITCTFIVGLVDFVTKDKIAEQAELNLLNTLHSIIEPSRLNNDLYNDCLIVSDPLLGNGIEQTVYLARFNEQPIAAAITATAPDGYNGNISLLIAVNINGSISGVRTLQHNETPGLGDKIELRKSDWIKSFSNKTFEGENDKRWAVKKDGGTFDQFTGATITPRAVVNAVRNTAIYFNDNKTSLFTSNASCRQNS